MTEVPFLRFEQVVLERPLGAGAFGEVFLGFADGSSTPVAIKRLNRRFDESTGARAIRELKALSLARSPHIVSVLGHCIQDNTLHIVMEYVEGTSLDRVPGFRWGARKDESRRRVHQRVSTLLDFMGRIGLSILNGLVTLEERGIVHRDIKPANVLVPSDPNLPVKLADFGLAKVIDDSFDGSRTGVFMGTALYSAPEQIRDSKRADHRSDLYSFAVMARELFLGANEFGGENVYEVMSNHLAEERVELYPRVAKVGRAEVLSLCKILDLLVSPRPNDRIHSARVVRKIISSGSDDWIGKREQWLRFVRVHRRSFESFFDLETANALVFYAESLQGLQ